MIKEYPRMFSLHLTEEQYAFVSAQGGSRYLRALLGQAMSAPEQAGKPAQQQARATSERPVYALSKAVQTGKRR